MARTLPFRLRNLAAAFAVLVAVIVIWSAYQSVINTTDPASQTLPIIRADSEPFRVLPEDPGGIDIPNQGSRLFNVLNAENADELALSGITIEQEKADLDTLDPVTTDAEGFALPEIPQAQRESLFDEIDSLKDKQVIEDDPDLTVMSEQEKQDLVAILESEIEEIEQENTAPVPVAKREEKIEPIEEPAETKPIMREISVLPSRKPQPPQRKVKREETQAQEPPKQFSLDRILAQDPMQRDNFYIQLASLKTEADARAAYDRIRDNFPQLVQGAGAIYPAADLGRRGTFYRVQIGPFSEAEANKRCADYRSAAGGGTCLVVSR